MAEDAEPDEQEESANAITEWRQKDVTARGYILSTTEVDSIRLQSIDDTVDSNHNFSYSCHNREC